MRETIGQLLLFSEATGFVLLETTRIEKGNTDQAASGEWHKHLNCIANCNCSSNSQE